MRNHAIARLCVFAALVVAFALYAGSAAPVPAQEGGPSVPPATKELPIRHAPGTKLTAQQMRGAGIFIEHCALCHLNKTQGSGGSKYCCVQSLGPNLAGMFTDMSPDQEKSMRDYIMDGGPTYMPAWKYTLQPKDVDDIIAYLKTLN